MGEQMMLPGCGMALAEKIQASLETMRMWEPSALEANPDRGFHLAFSGGKDSVVLKRIADMAGVKYEAVYNVTTIDPPEVVRFIRREHPDVKWNRPERPFFVKVVEKGLPTRRMRWCCEYYKEGSGDGWTATGVRAAESPRRKKAWKTVTRWTKGKTPTFMLAPILYWSDEDVWKFIKQEDVPYCSLYDEGFKRLGCIGCPMASERGRTREFERWPRYERLWRKAAHKLWDRRHGSMQRDGVTEWFGSARFSNADEMFNWWKSNKGLPKDDDEGCGMGLW